MKIKIKQKKWFVLLLLTIFVSTANNAYADSDSLDYYLGFQYGYNKQKFVDAKASASSSLGIKENGYTIKRPGSPGAIYLGVSKPKNSPFRYGFEFNDDITVGSAISATETRNIIVKSYSLMLNTYYDFHNSSPILPYLFFSVGQLFGSVQIEDNNPDSLTLNMKKTSYNQPVWGAGLGVSRDFLKWKGWKLDYLVKYTSDLSIFADNGIPISSKNRWKSVSMTQFMIGLRYQF